MEEPIPIAGPSSQPLVKKARRKPRRSEVNGEGEPAQSGATEQKHHRKLHSQTTQKGKGKQRASSNQDDRWDGDEWDPVPLAEKAVSKIPPIWSKDGRFYFSVAGSSIHIHSSTPPAYTRLSTLSSNQKNGYRKPITALSLSPTNALQLISASEDGTVKVWDWVEGRLIRSIVFSPTPSGSLRHMCLGAIGGKWWIFGIVSEPKEGKEKKGKSEGQSTHRIYRCPLSAPAAAPIYIGKLSGTPSALLISPNFTYLVALSINKAYTYRLPLNPSKSDWRPQCVKFVSDQPFTCGSFAPPRTLGGVEEEEWFATGDTRGNIRLWHGLATAFRQLEVAGDGDTQKAFPETEKRLPTTSLHWHAHAVGALAFTPSGAQLLSVGEESVLVQWHLASGKREFIPRLGGKPIVSLAVKAGLRGVEEEWWMSLSDGGLVHVGAGSGVIKSVGQGVRLDPLRPKSTSPYPLLLHPVTRALILPSSHSSTLQFIDMQSPSVLFDLEVAPSNRVSRTNERELESIAVERVAFSSDGRWMATMEGRRGDEVEGGGSVKTLKIWARNGAKYSINTLFPRPHGTSDVSSISFSAPPASISSTPISLASAIAAPYLLTTGVDGSVKLWQAREAKKSEQGKTSKKPPTIELFWAMRTSFDYRSMPIYDAAFSPDATILALAHGESVTLWDVDTNSLLQAFDAGIVASRVILAGSEGRYLVASGERGVCVWDLLSCEITWSAPTVSATTLLTTPSSSHFIVAGPAARKGSYTTFSVFSPVSQTPVRQIRIRHSFLHICLLASTPTSPNEIQFIGVSKDGEIYRFGDDVSAPSHRAKAVNNAQQKGTSIWQEMFGKDAFIEVEDIEEPTPVTALSMRTHGKASEVYDGPSHTLPPVGLLFDSFMEEILSNTAAKAEKMDVDEKIIYEKDAEVLSEALGANREAKCRVVTEDEMLDLEGFFKEVLTAKPSHTGRVDEAHGGQSINGADVSSGTSTSDDEGSEESGEESENDGDEQRDNDDEESEHSEAIEAEDPREVIDPVANGVNGIRGKKRKH